jgi:hypothetical protein
MTSRHLVSACLIMAAATNGTAQMVQPPQIISPPPTITFAGQPSRKLDARIYFDATSSMSGYAAPAAGTAFVAFVQKLEQTFAFGWQQYSVKCFKFGATIQPLVGPSCYLQPLKPAFYDLTGKDDITRIDQVIRESGVPGTLSIVLSDLYQDDADLGVLFRAIHDHLIPKNLAMGVLAFQSQFDGTIYDIGLTRGSRRWQGKRPVYALVIGAGADVAKYFHELSKPPAYVPKDQFLILGQGVVGNAIEWSTSRRSAPRNVAEDPTFIQVEKTSVSFGLLRLQGGGETSSLTLSFPEIYATPFHPRLRWEKLGTSVFLHRLGQGGRATTTPNHPAFRAEVETTTKPSPPQTSLILHWAGEKLLRNQVYLSEVRLSADVTAIVFPKFVSSWSISADSISTDKSRQFDGALTQNLSEFIQGVARVFLQASDGELGVVYVYLKK